MCARSCSRKDFIYSLDAPTTYFGPDKVFLDERAATDSEADRRLRGLSPAHAQKRIPVAELPPEPLSRARSVHCGARYPQPAGQEGKHCSMMINVSRFVSVQKACADFITLREEDQGRREDQLHDARISFAQNVYMAGPEQRV